MEDFVKPKGVSYDKSKDRWKARIRIEGRLYHLGQYPTMEEALKVYNACKRYPDPLSFAIRYRNSTQWGVRKYEGYLPTNYNNDIAYISRTKILEFARNKK